jgi:HAD superfamily hydrolase (TIGR01509 family)
VLIANRLTVPDGTPALLWDMDGVLLDTLTMDYELVNRILSSHTAPEVPRETIQEFFPYDIPEFWRRLLKSVGLEVSPNTFDEMVREHEKARESADIVIHEGVTEILADARGRGLLTAAVSNNPLADIDRMLVAAGLREYFSVVVGNDDPGLAKKPAPDSYLEATRRLGLTGTVPPAAIEDSLLGAQAAQEAGCWTVGVATGAADFEALSASPYVNRTYTRFALCRVLLGWEGVTKKSLVTPNEFVSHMIEHIAWRLGCSVDVMWTNDDWHGLGHELGVRVAEMCRLQGTAAALGMIDDGSCEVGLRCGSGKAALRAAGQVDLDWFLGLRCEQLTNGQPLVSVLDGLAAGSGVDLDILVASAEDPHHTWEGIFRGVGIGLKKLTTARESAQVTVAAASSSPRESSPSRQARPQPLVEQGWDVR